MRLLTAIASLLTLSAAAANYPTSEPIKSIPLPPEGQRWIVNEQLTDEFDGDTLDKTKWLDHHPTWRGREPGLFMPKNVALKGGCMVLHGEKMERDTVIKGTTYNVSCAAVVSREQIAHYGYYECRFKANQSTLSSTFWFSTRAGAKSTEGRQPKGAVKGKFGQELDVCECIGRTGDFKGKFFADGMNSNVHYWFSPDGGGEKQNITIKETRLRNEDGSKPADGFNTYGCWWRDKNSASFYLNNGQAKHREFIGREKWGKPYDIDFNFTEPMSLNMVVETYPYPWIPLPTDEELADPQRNRTLYDWVRAYTLVDAAEANRGASRMYMFESRVNIADKPTVFDRKCLTLSLHYTSPDDCSIELAIYDAKSDKQIGKESIKAAAGYANIKLESSVARKAKSGKEYYIVTTIIDKSGNVAEGDSFLARAEE